MESVGNGCAVLNSFAGTGPCGHEMPDPAKGSFRIGVTQTGGATRSRSIVSILLILYITPPPLKRYRMTGFWVDGFFLTLAVLKRNATGRKSKKPGGTSRLIKS